MGSVLGDLAGARRAVSLAGALSNSIGIIINSPHPIVVSEAILDLVMIEPMLGYQRDPGITRLERTGIMLGLIKKIEGTNLNVKVW